LSSFSDILWTVEHLTSLDLSGNPKLVSVPEDIDRLRNLKKLRLVGNNMAQLPASILGMSSLVSLELEKNKLDHFYERDYKTGAPLRYQTDVKLPELSYLSLNGNNLTSIPAVCKHMPKLTQMHLHMNRITEVGELCRKEFGGL